MYFISAREVIARTFARNQGDGKVDDGWRNNADHILADLYAHGYEVRLRPVDSPPPERR
jgi:hypothetical protein